MTVLSVEHLDVAYGKAQVVFDVSLEVGESEIVGVLGRNGAGKTSLLRALMNLEVHSSGRVTHRGDDVTKLKPEMLARRGFGWVPDNRAIFPDMSVRDNLRLAMRKTDGDILERLFEALPILKRLIDRSGSELSGGEQQVVAIARGLVSQPNLLLLDEPTEGLAPVVVEQLKDVIVKFPEMFGVSILLADENLSVSLDLCSRVYVLDGGQLVYSGSAEAFAAEKELQNKYLAV